MSDSDETWSDFESCIRIAGNTGPRCLFVLWQKGYSIRHFNVLKGSGDYQSEFEAKIGTRLFSATSPEELLGLIALWETRGESWRDSSDEEWAKFERLIDEAPVFDEEGNEIVEI